MDGRSGADQDCHRFPCIARVEFCNQSMGAGASLARVCNDDLGVICVLLDRSAVKGIIMDSNYECRKYPGRNVVGIIFYCDDDLVLC